MQSVNQATIGVSSKPMDIMKNGREKENVLSPPKCLLQGTQKPTLQKIVLGDRHKSKLPVPSKARAPPDFQKMHQAWQNRFQKGKAVSKKSCTRPQPFNFSQKGDQYNIPAFKNVTGNLTGNPPSNNKVREPLAEVITSLKNVNCKDAELKDNSEVEFKADPAALFSILSNAGVPAAATAGKLSLAQRVPMRMSSATQQFSSCRNMMVRSSMYTIRSNQTASSNFDRLSCFSKMHAKDNDQKPQCRLNEILKGHIPDTSLVSEPAACKKNDKLQSQENPILQQMNPSHLSPPRANKEISAVRSTLLPLTENAETTSSPAEKCQKFPLEVKVSAEKNDPVSQTGDQQNTDSADFVADSQALNSILSNTGVMMGSCGKLSLAQRVPVQGVMLKGGMTFPVPATTQTTTPKPIYGRMSTMAVPLKEIVFSPCRVPNTVVTNDQSSGGSARRVCQPQGSAMKFSQPRSVKLKHPIFPKTPRALALEKANLHLEAEPFDFRTATKSTVKWVDELSPSPISEVVCENEPDMEQVAVRLFSDVDCPGELAKDKELAEASDILKVLNNSSVTVQLKVEAVPPENSVTNADEVTPGDPEDFVLHNLHLAPLSQLNTMNLPQPSSCVSLPLSFLSHPAVKSLQSHSLGPLSLPRIAQLRLEATMSSKQRFWDAYLDEECAFYTSRGPAGCCRSNCEDPVSSFLQKQEDLHFTPILLGDS